LHRDPTPTLAWGLLLAWVLLLPASLPSVAAGAPWHEHYVRGFELLEGGEAAAAIPELEAALAQRSEEELKVRVYGMHYVDYLPHLQLARAHLETGNLAASRGYLAAAEATGLAARSEAGRPLLEDLRRRLGTPAAESPRPATPTADRDSAAEQGQQLPAHASGVHDAAGTDWWEGGLTDAEYADLRRTVLSRCRLPDDLPPERAPWYFHYDLGLELLERGDAPRALDALLESTARRHDPQRRARIYGMWFEDYLPYFHIARIEAQLGHWECVADALAISARLEEVTAGDEEWEELQTLKTETTQRSQENDKP
jgi:hypothetical protein